MADLLRRSLAPLSDAAWEEIDETASRILKANLSARRIFHIDGPHGWQLGAVNLGRLEVSHEPGPAGQPWGTRQVLPLIETRIPITLGQMELDAIARGAKDADLRPVEIAARNAALAEESAVYQGFPPGGIQGVLQQATYPPIQLPEKVAAYPGMVACGIQQMESAGIVGPYVLVLGPNPYYSLLQSTGPGHPPRRIIEDLTGQKILHSPVLEGGVLLGPAKDYFELVIGEDFAIGYFSHDREHVELYITESFTFRVLEPAAAIALR